MNDHKNISSTVSLNVIAAVAQSTGEVLTPAEFEKRTRLFLDDMRKVQQELINANVSTLPNRDNDKFGSKWARENIASTKNADAVLEPYIETYWTLNGCKSEAARLILGYRKRLEVWNTIQAIGDDATFDEVRERLNKKWLDYRLYQNIRNSKTVPRVPVIDGVSFPYCQMNKQVGQQKTFLDGTMIHNLAMGSERYEVLFDTQNIYERYPDIISLSRPTVLLTNDGSVKWHFSVMQSVPVPSTRGYSQVVAFDRNMDHARIISGVRACRNGHVSKELGPSLRTVRTAEHSRRVNVDLDRKREKLSNLMPWNVDSGKAERLRGDIERVRGALDRLHDALDVLSVDDMVGHLRPGEALVVERLDMFGGGPVKFRHGKSDDRLEHKCSRLGIPLIMVNPAGTTSSCPHCGAGLVFKSGRVVECPDCGFSGDRDCGASPIIAGRGLDRSAGARRYERIVGRNVRSAVEERERCERRREKRLLKLERRRARGVSSVGVGSVSSPSRPVSGVREGVSCQGSSLARLRVLLDERRQEFLERSRADGGNCVIAGFYRIHGLGSWATNTLCFEYGLSDMRCSLSAILSGEILPPDKAGLRQLFTKRK